MRFNTDSATLHAVAILGHARFRDAVPCRFCFPKKAASLVRLIFIPLFHISYLPNPPFVIFFSVV